MGSISLALQSQQISALLLIFCLAPQGWCSLEDKGFPLGLQLKEAGKALTAGAEAPPAQSFLQKEESVHKPPCLRRLCLPSNAAGRIDPALSILSQGLGTSESAGLGLQVPSLHAGCYSSLGLNKKLL